MQARVPPGLRLALRSGSRSGPRGLALGALLPVLFAVAACGGGPPSPEAAPGPPATETEEAAASPLHFGFSLPETLPGVPHERVFGRHLLAHSLGYSLRYQDSADEGSESAWSLFIYPVVPDGEPLAPDALPERLADEFESAVADVHTHASQQEWTVEEVSAPEADVREGPSGPVELIQQVFRLNAESDEPLDSRVVVGIVDRAFLKMRTTYPTAQGAHREEADPAFLDAVVQSFEAGGVEGMAGYDREAARQGPLPDDIPETFGWQFPPRLPLGFVLLGEDRLPERDDGIVAVYRVQGYQTPLQLFLRPLYDEGDAAEPIDPDRVDATWQENREDWAAQIEEGLAGQGFEPVTEAPVAKEPEEVHTLYGPQPLHRLTWHFEDEEGRQIVARLASARVENLLMVSGHMGPPPLAAEVHEEFVLELLANLLVWRPPPR